jgi:diguanylate cyclase (GGDEF)-like protein
MAQGVEQDGVESAEAALRDDGAPLRVILVGRTGLDARLRLDSGLELVRVRTALEAVGELSDPLDREAPGPAVVIVSPDADPAGAAHIDAARAREFTGALRLLDPQVRVLRLEAGDGSAPSRGGYDGVISPDVSSEVLRAAVRGEPRPPRRAPAPVAVEVKPAPEAPVEVAPLAAALAVPTAGAGESGDEGLVRALMSGRDILEPAMEAIRQRLGGREVAYVPGPISEGAATRAVVGWRGRVFGSLRSGVVSGAELAPHASWLASWLALREQQAQLQDAAFTDPLTGAFNRRYFDHFIQVAIAQAAGRRQSLTVLVFDLDNFKQFNDQHGHAHGDEILKESVRLLRSVIRPSDKVCRIGGDEFVVIFHEPEGPRNPTSRHPTSVFQIARRFQDAIAAHKFPKLGREAPGALAISGGLATYPWDGRSAIELLARADELAIQSKRTGKNCITLGPGAERERDADAST